MATTAMHNWDPPKESITPEKVLEKYVELYNAAYNAVREKTREEKNRELFERKEREQIEKKAS